MPMLRLIERLRKKWAIDGGVMESDFIRDMEELYEEVDRIQLRQKVAALEKIIQEHEEVISQIRSLIAPGPNSQPIKRLRKEG